MVNHKILEPGAVPLQKEIVPVVGGGHTTQPRVKTFCPIRWVCQGYFSSANRGTVALIIVMLAATALVHIIATVQPAAVVNGVVIPASVFAHYQDYTRLMLENQEASISLELQSIRHRTKSVHKEALIVQPVSSLEFQQRLLRSALAYLPIHTLTMMEHALELQQAAKRLDAAPTAAQFDAAMDALRKEMGGTISFNRLLNTTTLLVS